MAADVSPPARTALRRVGVRRWVTYYRFGLRQSDCIGQSADYNIGSFPPSETRMSVRGLWKLSPTSPRLRSSVSVCFVRMLLFCAWGHVGIDACTAASYSPRTSHTTCLISMRLS